MSKARGQSRMRALKRGVVDINGNSLKRPFNNSKRTRGRKDQIKAEKYYRYLKSRIFDDKALQSLIDKIENESEGIQ